MSKIQQRAEQFAKVTHPAIYDRKHLPKYAELWRQKVQYFMKAAKESVNAEAKEAEFGYLCGLFYREKNNTCGCESSEDHVEKRGFDPVNATT